QGEGSYRQMLLDIGRRYYPKPDGKPDYKHPAFSTFEQLRCFRNLIVHRVPLPISTEEYSQLVQYRSRHDRLLRTGTPVQDLDWNTYNRSSAAILLRLQNYNQVRSALQDLMG